MDLNAFIFPAPKRPPKKSDLEGILIEVPIYFPTASTLSEQGKKPTSHLRRYEERERSNPKPINTGSIRVNNFFEPNKTEPKDSDCKPSFGDDRLVKIAIPKLSFNLTRSKNQMSLLKITDRIHIKNIEKRVANPSDRKSRSPSNIKINFVPRQVDDTNGEQEKRKANLFGFRRRINQSPQ